MSYDDSDEFRAWKKRVEEELAPKIKGANICLHLVPQPGDIDAKFCVELGMAIMLDKPIIALVRPGAKTSKKLMTVADEIIECDPEAEDGQRALREVISRYMAKHPN